MPERNSSSPTLGRRPKWTLVATHHCNDRVHNGYVVSQDFLQMKEKWTRKNNEDVDEQDAKNLLRQKRLCETRLFPENVVEKS